MMTAFEQTAALSAAIGLGLFSAIAKGARTVDALSEACAAAPRGVRILSDTLAVYGLLTKEDGLYSLTPDTAAFLDEAQPTYIGAAAWFLASKEKIALYFDDAVGWARRGGPVDQANTTPDSRIWVDFARGMANFMRPIAESLAETLASEGPADMRVLDIAAGHGLFGIELAKRRLDAHVTALDWAAVLEVAVETAQGAGIGERFETRAGSAFDAELGGPYDLVLIPNFLPHFDRVSGPGVCELARTSGRAARRRRGDCGVHARRLPRRAARPSPVCAQYVDRNARRRRLYGGRVGGDVPSGGLGRRRHCAPRPDAANFAARPPLRRGPNVRAAHAT
jgi:hypothetical protein